MFYGIKEEDVVGYALLAAGCMGMTDKQRENVEKKILKLMQEHK